jgi:hypothetical protein
MVTKILSLLCLVAVTIMALPAMAEVKVVGTQSSGAPLTIKTDFGKVVDAVNLGGESLTCDGVSFTGQTVPENTTAKQTIETTPFTVTLRTGKSITVVITEVGRRSSILAASRRRGWAWWL